MTDYQRLKEEAQQIQEFLEITHIQYKKNGSDDRDRSVGGYFYIL